MLTLTIIYTCNVPGTSAVVLDQDVDKRNIATMRCAQHKGKHFMQFAT